MIKCLYCDKEYPIEFIQTHKRSICKYPYKLGQEIIIDVCIYCSAKRENDIFDNDKRNKKWNDLSKKYPRIFNKYNGKDCCGNEVYVPENAAGGVGDGWYPIIEEACEKIQAELDKIGPNAICHFQQMKEKFGTLRWYTSFPEKKSLIRTFIRWYNYTLLSSASGQSDSWKKFVVKHKLWRYRLPYWRNSIEKIIDEAENKSAVTCEWCGKPGILRTDRGWVLTLCDDCYEKDNKSIGRKR